MTTSVRQVCEQARAAAAVTRELDASAKDAVLVSLADAIEAGRDQLQARERDRRRAARAGRRLRDAGGPADPDRFAGSPRW